MLRTTGAVIAGYLVMALFIFASFSVAYIAMGTEGAYAPGSFDVSMLWIVSSSILGLIAAIIGGYVCASIARSPRAIPALMGLILVLGLASAFAAAAENPDNPDAREGDIAVFEAMSAAKTPLWVALLNPLIGVGGVLVGARLKKRSESATV